MLPSMHLELKIPNDVFACVAIKIKTRHSDIFFFLDKSVMLIKAPDQKTKLLYKTEKLIVKISKNILFGR